MQKQLLVAFFVSALCAVSLQADRPMMSSMPATYPMDMMMESEEADMTMDREAICDGSCKCLSTEKKNGEANIVRSIFNFGLATAAFYAYLRFISLDVVAATEKAFPAAPGKKVSAETATVKAITKIFGLLLGYKLMEKSAGQVAEKIQNGIDATYNALCSDSCCAEQITVA